MSHADTDTQTQAQSQYLRGMETPLEQLLIASALAARWKWSSVTAPASRSSTASAALAAGTALEIERRSRTFNTPLAISYCTGTVTAPPDIRASLAEMPALQSAASADTDGQAPLSDTAEAPLPGGLAASRDHWWIRVDAAGAAPTYHLDPNVPPQVSGRPDDAALVRPRITPLDTAGATPQERPPTGYTCHKRTPIDASSGVTPDHVPWGPATDPWPFGTPTHLNHVQTDGNGTDGRHGKSICTPDTNQVVQCDARTGLRQLPADSLDTVISSPPYRLQRSYPAAETVWGGDPDCEHDWVTEELYTDTPIRDDGGAGFNSSDDAAELRAERWRPSHTCRACDAWRGQLGLEPTLEQYIDHLMTIFDAVQRALAPDGSFWLNIADSWADGHTTADGDYRDAPPKSLAGVPVAVEQAMREAGWIVRERHAWVKPHPTPDPAHDRATPAWEYVFRFVTSESYLDATPQPATDVLTLDTARGTDHAAPMPRALPQTLLDRTFPQDTTGVVCDPFAGSGTVLVEAAAQGHDYLGFEIDADAVATARERLQPYDRTPQSLTGQTSLTQFD